MHFPCELTLRDFHLRKIRKPFITHIALTATKIYFRAVFFLYTISPANKQRNNENQHYYTESTTGIFLKFFSEIKYEVIYSQL